MIGLSEKTVQDKITLLTKLEDSVLEQFKEGNLSARKGLVIVQLPEEEQPEFTRKMKDQNWTRDELRTNMQEFQNDSLVTIGCDSRARPKNVYFAGRFA